MLGFVLSSRTKSLDRPSSTTATVSANPRVAVFAMLPAILTITMSYEQGKQSDIAVKYQNIQTPQLFLHDPARC